MYVETRLGWWWRGLVDCSGYEQDRESLSLKIAEHYIRNALGVPVAGGIMGSVRHYGDFSEVLVHRPSGGIRVLVTLVRGRGRNYVIALQTGPGPGPYVQREHEYFCTSKGIVFTPRFMGNGARRAQQRRTARPIA